MNESFSIFAPFIRLVTKAFVMVSKTLIKKVIVDQQEIRPQMDVQRKIDDQWLSMKEIVVVSGVRRCGKSVLLQQFREKMVERDYFFNFDDERLINFSVDDFQILQECFIELFGVQHTYYFDEIQNVVGWERFVRRLYDAGNKIFITGSNANMLSRELGTHLTGRYIQVELYPFSFREYLSLIGYELDNRKMFSTVGHSELLAHFNTYMSNGGFPAYLQNKSTEYLSALYDSIIYRDVLQRNRLVSEREILEMMHYLASNASKRHSYTSIGRIIGVKHPETVKNYLQCVEATYLLFQIARYAPSLKTQSATPKKIYLIDNAIINKIGFNPTMNLGILLENIVFIELKRRGKNVFYYAGNGECDFVVRQGTTLTEAYQVTLEMDREETKNREIAGLLEVAKVHQTANCILTLDEEDELTIDGIQICVKPVWKWMLEE